MTVSKQQALELQRMIIFCMGHSCPLTIKVEPRSVINALSQNKTVAMLKTRS
jgi:hypothetical protein